MKKIVLILLVCLLLCGITQPVTAQGPVIYLPVIVKGSETMTTWAKLEISDGTTTVNLIAGGATGFHLKDWNPQIIQPKEGGVFQDSPIAPGRRLVYAVDATAIETMTIDVNDYDEDSLIEQAQDLMRLLNKARAYGGTTDYQDTPVYIRARSDCETNDRYAVIINWAIPELDNPYAPPFVVAGEIALMDDLTLQLERGHWTANAPGVGTCAQASSQQVWDYGLNLTQVASAPPNANPVAFVRHPVSGNLYAPANRPQIVRSVDGGATWADHLTVAPVPNGNRAAIVLANNNILVGGAGSAVGIRAIARTTNDGGAWADVSLATMNEIKDFVQVPATATVIAVGTDTAANYAAIYRSTNNGASWSLVYSITVFGSGAFNHVIVDDNGSLLAILNRYTVYRSTDDGVSWVIVGGISTTRTSNGFINGFINGSDGKIYAIDELQGASPSLDTSMVFVSNDYGATWGTQGLITARLAGNLIEGNTAGEFWATFNNRNTFPYTGELWKSQDYGISWKKVGDLATHLNADPIFTGIAQMPDGRVYTGAGSGTLAGYIFRTGVSAETTLGRSATCNNEVYIANRHNIANITHVYRDDGGAFTSIFPAVLPVSLFPAAPAVNDALYVGSQSSVVDSGPFGGAVFDIGTVMSGDITLAVEYWNGAWVALTNRDGTNSFSFAGVNSIHWVQPSDWATTAVNGVTGYWIRFRVTGVAGTIQVPTQQNRNIYAVNQAFVDIDEAQVLGDIAAIAQIKAHNRSDYDGPGGSGPNLYENRLVAGLRSYDRGDVFQAYLNISDEQNPFGVTVTAGTTTTIDTDVTAPTGRRATFAPAGAEAMLTRATIALSSTIARDFYGTYHAFLRARRTAGAVADLTVRLQIATGSGGITFTTTGQQLQTTTAFEVLDFGEITLPVSSSFKSTDLADTTEIRIQASAASGTPDLYLYDLILIPVDEWAVDAVDMANESDSDVGRSNGLAKLLDIDSVTDPRIDIKTLVRTADASEFITAEYNPITGGSAILQANVDQRLWFFAMQTSATGLSYSWIAPPEIAHSIQLYHNSRYLGMRGSR